MCTVPSRSYFRIRLRARQRRARSAVNGSTDIATGTPFLYGPHILTCPDVTAKLEDQRVAPTDIQRQNLYEKLIQSESGNFSEDDERQIEQLLGRVRPARGFCASLFDTASVKIGDTIVRGHRSLTYTHSHGDGAHHPHACTSIR